MGTILVRAQRARGENRKRGEIRGKGRDPLFVKCPHLFVIGCNVYSASYVTYMYVWIIESLPPPPPQRDSIFFICENCSHDCKRIRTKNSPQTL